MICERVVSLYALLGSIAYAQTNPVPVEEPLTITYGERTIHAPDALMHPGHMSDEPNISTPTWEASSDSAILIMIDRDAPLDGARVNLLHWLVTDVTLANDDGNPSSENQVPLNIPEAQVPYLQPDPPVGDVAHAYQFYLVSPQPSEFSIPPQYNNLAENRAPFDLNEFLVEIGLDETNIIARNHFRVRNLAGHPTTTFPPPRPSETASVTGRPPGQTSVVEEITGAGVSSVGEERAWRSILTTLLTGFTVFVWE